MVAAILLGITAPVAVRRGWEVPEWGPLLVIVATVGAFVLLGRRRG